MKKKIVVICGTGIATSTVVAQRVRDICASNGIDADVVQGRAVEAELLAEGANLVVTTTPTLQIKRPVKIINGVPFLTGIGMEDVAKSIVEELQK